MALALALAALGVAHPPLRMPKAVTPSATSLWYSNLVEHHYLPLAACQMGIVRLASDCIGQATNGAAFDTTHAFAMAFVGVTVSGTGGALWLRHLEGALGPSDGSTSMVLRKTAADYLCWAPVVNSANLVIVSLLTVRRRWVAAHITRYCLHAATCSPLTRLCSCSPVLSHRATHLTPRSRASRSTSRRSCSSKPPSSAPSIWSDFL